MPRVSREHMRKRRAQIVSAALRCFRSKGIAETRMRDIFAESGLSAGAVYNHFASKDELIEFLARESEQKWLAVFAACRDEPDQTPRERLTALVGEMIDGLERPETVADIAGDVGLWAFSIHRAPLRAACRDLFLTVARGFDRILAGHDGSPDSAASLPGSSAGAHLLAHLQGLGLQAAMGVPLDLGREKDLVRTIIDHVAEESASC